MPQVRELETSGTEANTLATVLHSMILFLDDAVRRQPYDNTSTFDVPVAAATRLSRQNSSQIEQQACVDTATCTSAAASIKNWF
jgi:hypothetical protein